MKTLNDFEDMRITKVYKNMLLTPEIKEHDEIASMIHDAYFFNYYYSKEKIEPKIKFVIDDEQHSKDGFIISRMTEEALKASLSKNVDDIVDSILEVIYRSLLLKIIIKDHETVELYFIAPIEIGVTKRKKLTNKFVITLKRSIGKLSHGPNSYINMFRLDSIRPVSKIPKLVTLFTIKGNETMKAQNCSEIYDIEDYFKNKNPEMFPSTDIEACIDHAFRTSCKFKTDYIRPLEGYTPSTKRRNCSAFNTIENWYDLQCAIEKSVVVEIIPGHNRQIFIVFKCKEAVGYEVIRQADIDAEYTVKSINGCLRAVGPFEYVKKNTAFFTVALDPVIVDKDHKKEEFAATSVFPGYPKINHLFDGLNEGDVIYGSEVIARELQPVMLEEK